MLCKAWLLVLLQPKLLLSRMPMCLRLLIWPKYQMMPSPSFLLPRGCCLNRCCESMLGMVWNIIGGWFYWLTSSRMFIASPETRSNSKFIASPETRSASMLIGNPLFCSYCACDCVIPELRFLRRTTLNEPREMASQSLRLSVFSMHLSNLALLSLESLLGLIKLNPKESSL